VSERNLSDIRVVIVDDQPLVRAGLRMVLSAQPDMTVIGEAGDGAEALRLLGKTQADVVVMDIRMPVMDGVEATRLLCAEPGGPRVLVLTTFDTDEDAFAALQAGASAFLLKNAPRRSCWPRFAWWPPVMPSSRHG
jgi:DNA-binding NarL/FixJ family response regulator